MSVLVINFELAELFRYNFTFFNRTNFWYELSGVLSILLTFTYFFLKEFIQNQTFSSDL